MYTGMHVCDGTPYAREKVSTGYYKARINVAGLKGLRQPNPLHSGSADGKRRPVRIRAD